MAETETPTVESEAPAAERRLQPNLTQSVGEIMAKGREGAPEPPAAEEDPWAPLGERAREIAQAKGWKGPEDMLKAYEAATTRLSQRDEEKEAYLAELARLEAQQQQAYQPQQQQAQSQQQPAALDFDALAASVVDPQTGEPNHARMLELATALGARMAYDAAMVQMEQRFAQFESERVAPLTQAQEEARIAEELAALEQRYGADYDPIRERIEERMKEEPDYLDRFSSLRGAFADTLYELQAEQAQERQQAAEGHTLRSGGRRPPAPTLTQAQAELAAMESYRRRPNDGLALDSRLRWG
jgi:hypothetical protein